MKKSTNKYRKCPNCPHHSSVSKRCCCQRSSTSTLRPRAVTSRPKKQPSTIDNTLNTTIPTIMADYPVLKTQVNQLKKHLLNASALNEHSINQSHYINSLNPVLSTFTTESQSLVEKLFQANKNAKQAYIQIDSLSRINKDLYERNNHLANDLENYKIQLDKAQDEIDKYKKKYRKLNKLQDNKENNPHVVNQRNNQLEEEVYVLREEIKTLRVDHRNSHKHNNFSPGWVAHTNNKSLKPFEPNNPNRIDQSIPSDFQQQTIDMFKKSLSETINLLKNQTNNFHCSSYDHFGDPHSHSLSQMIQSFAESFSQSIYGFLSIIRREIERKINVHEKKVAHICDKLENMLIGIRNRKLKERVFSFSKDKERPILNNRYF